MHTEDSLDSKERVIGNGLPIRDDSLDAVAAPVDLFFELASSKRAKSAEGKSTCCYQLISSGSSASILRVHFGAVTEYWQTPALSADYGRGGKVTDWQWH